MRKIFRFKRIFLSVFLTVGLFLVGWWFNQQRLTLSPAAGQAAPSKLQISFLDVGQGDAILIKTPSGKNILLDGGDDREKLLLILNNQLGWLNRRLTYEILSHPHADHLNGLNGLFGRFTIDEAIATLVNGNSSAYVFWLDNLLTQNIKTTAAAAPQIFETGDGVSLRVLSPLENLENKTVDNLNNSSLVIMLTYGQVKFLLMGDAEEPVEEALLAKGEDVAAQVLKVAHHGSSTATGQAFLSAVGPQVAVISVGKNNDFGHPHIRVLNRLARAGVKILRTDQLGTITMLTDGQALEIVE